MTTRTMNAQTQSSNELFRILLYRNDATEILLETTSEGFRLPVLPIPRYRRVAEELTDAVRSTWHLETYCLFALPNGIPPHDFVHDQVMETCHPQVDPPARMQWFVADSLFEGSFQAPSDFAAVQNSRITLGQYRRNERPGPFGKPNWLRSVTEWVEDQAKHAGLRVNGKFRQLNAGPSFSLIRFETDGTALWFKAVGEPNVHEHPVTIKLASAFPEFLPRILACRPEWNAWLSLESEGSPLGADSNEAAWALTAENLALLQISSFGRRFELIEAGCKDLRPCMLRNLVHPFFDSMTELMEKQTKLFPAPLGRHELLSLGCEITSLLGELEDAGVPNTLGHLDLNAGNILVSDTQCVFLDWAEAYVGPPFFSFQYLLEHWRRLHQQELFNDRSPLACYGKHWTSLATAAQFAASFQLAPLLAAFAYAASGLTGRSPESIRPETAAHLRSLVRRMKREADALRERRSGCLP
jgi:hypothetical protein